MEFAFPAEIDKPRTTEDLLKKVGVPNPLPCNMEKRFFATYYRELIKAVQEIAGRLVVIMPTEANSKNTATRGCIKTYLTLRKPNCPLSDPSHSNSTEKGEKTFTLPLSL